MGVNRWTYRLLSVYHQSCRWDATHADTDHFLRVHCLLTTEFTITLCLPTFTDFTSQWWIGQVAWTVLAAFTWGIKAMTPAWSKEQGRTQQAPDWSAPCTHGKVASVTLICQEPSCILSGSPCSTPVVVLPAQLVYLVLRITRDQTSRRSKHHCEMPQASHTAVTVVILPLPAFQLQLVKPSGMSSLHLC